jgi:hypothetical protein
MRLARPFPITNCSLRPSSLQQNDAAAESTGVNCEVVGAYRNTVI